MVGVGEFEQFDGRAVFDYERDADAVGWAVGRGSGFRGQHLNNPGVLMFPVVLVCLDCGASRFNMPTEEFRSLLREGAARSAAA